MATSFLPRETLTDDFSLISSSTPPINYFNLFSLVSNEHKKIMAKNQEQFQTQITSLNKELEEFKTEKAVLVEKLVTISEEVDSSNR